MSSARLNEEKRLDSVRDACKAARANYLKPIAMNEQSWEAVCGEGGINLHDGQARIFTLSKTGRLHMNVRVRMAHAWMAPLSSDHREALALTKWPLSTLPKQNPFRSTYFLREVVQAPEWDKVNQQWKVEFECNPSITFWFCDEYIKAPGLDGWVMPRKQRQTVPWSKAVGVIKPPRLPNSFVPELTDDELRLLVKGDKYQVIRNLHTRHAQDIKDRLVCIMDIKESVEEILSVLEEK